MKHKTIVLAGALLAVLFAVSCKNECAFEPVYKDMLDVVDNPAKMDENKLAESKLPKLWDKSAVIDSMEKRVVVYGKGLNVKPAANNYGFVYEKTSPHAFALQITTFMDPEVSGFWNGGRRIQLPFRNREKAFAGCYKDKELRCIRSYYLRAEACEKRRRLVYHSFRQLKKVYKQTGGNEQHSFPPVSVLMQ